MVSYEALRKEFTELKDKTEHLVNISDVIVTASHASGIADVQALFNKDVVTPVDMIIKNNGWINFQLKTPMIVTDIAILSEGDTSVWGDIGYAATYEDGTTVTGTVTAVTNIGGKITLTTDKKLYSINLTNSSGSDIAIAVTEMVFYVSYTFVVDLKGGNIDLGSVKIQDANSSTEAKVDTDQAVIVGIDDTQGNRINPATDESVKDVVLQEQYGHKIGYDLVFITTPTNSSGDTASITDSENMFDGDPTTYASLKMPPKTNIAIHLKDPRTIEDIVLRVDSNFDYAHMQYVVEYADGTGKQGTYDGVHGDTAHIPVNTTKPVAYIAIYNSYTQELDFNVYELAMFATTRQKNVYIYDSGGHIINPAIKEIQQDIQSKIDNIYRFTDFNAKGDGNGSYISRVNEMFDNNTGSCGQVYLAAGGYAYMYPKVSTFLSTFVFSLKDPNGTGLPDALKTDYEVHYADGTISTGKIQQLYDETLYIPIDDSRPVDRLYFKNNTSNTLSFCIAELYTEKLMSSGAVGVRNEAGVRVNPATEDTLSKVLGALGDLRIITSDYIDWNNSLPKNFADTLQIENEDKIYDSDVMTFGVIGSNTSAGIPGYYWRVLQKPLKTNKLVMVLDINNSTPNSNGYINISIQAIPNGLSCEDPSSMTQAFKLKYSDYATTSTDKQVLLLEVPIGCDCDIGSYAITLNDVDTKLAVRFFGFVNHTTTSLVNLRGDKINPATEDTLHTILDYSTRFAYNDINISHTNTSGKTSISNMNLAFDGDTSTYASINLGASDTITFTPKMPVYLDHIYALASFSLGSASDVSVTIYYEDGTKKVEGLTEITSGSYIIKVDRTSRITKIVFENTSSSVIDFGITELYLLPLPLLSAEDRVKKYVLTNATVNAAGNSSDILVPNVKVAEVLIYVDSVTGAPNMTISLDVVDDQSGKVITSYTTSQITASGSDKIYVANDILGDVNRISWSGTLDSSNYFGGVYITYIGKR